MEKLMTQNIKHYTDEELTHLIHHAIKDVGFFEMDDIKITFSNGTYYLYNKKTSMRLESKFIVDMLLEIHRLKK